MDDIFKIIIDVFTSKKTSPSYFNSVESLQNLISQRPKIRAEVEEALRSTQFQKEYIKNDDDDNDVKDEENQEYENNDESEQMLRDAFLDPFEFEKKIDL